MYCGSPSYKKAWQLEKCQLQITMISPKYSATHYFHPVKSLANAAIAPHVVNLYLDYNCPFSAKIFSKFRTSVIPSLQKAHPFQFQFVYVNVVQPWHTNSVLLNEFLLAVAQLLADSPHSNEAWWSVSEALFANKEKFYDTSNINLTRNQIYEQIYEVVKESIPFSKKQVLEKLVIKESKEPSNGGNAVTNDLKYFTKYHRKAGVHVTPTVSVDGVVDDSISSGDEPEVLVKKFVSYL